MARIGFLAGGIVLLVLGIILFAYGAKLISEVNACLSGLVCSLAAALNSNNLQNAYNLGTAFETVGGILGLVGFVSLVVGAVSSKEETPAAPQAGVPSPQPPATAGGKQVVEPFRYCTKRRQQLRPTDQFCPRRGTARS